MTSSEIFFTYLYRCVHKHTPVHWCVQQLTVMHYNLCKTHCPSIKLIISLHTCSNLLGVHAIRDACVSLRNCCWQVWVWWQCMCVHVRAHHCITVHCCTLLCDTMQFVACLCIYHWLIWDWVLWCCWVLYYAWVKMSLMWVSLSLRQVHLCAKVCTYMHYDIHPCTWTYSMQPWHLCKFERIHHWQVWVSSWWSALQITYVHVIASIGNVMHSCAICCVFVHRPIWVRVLRCVQFVISLFLSIANLHRNYTRLSVELQI